MSCKSDGKMENHDENRSATESATQRLPSRMDTARSITPKGPLFPNLDVAHQAITSRLASRSAGNHITDTSLQSSPSASSCDVSGPTGSAQSLPPSAQHTEFGESRPLGRQQHLAPFSRIAQTNPESSETRIDPSPNVSSLASFSSGSSAVNTRPVIGGARDESASIKPLKIHGKPVEKSYDDHCTPSPVAEPASVTKEGSYSHHSETRFRGLNSNPPRFQRANTDIYPKENQGRMYHSPASESPQKSLPELLRSHGGTEHVARESGSGPMNFSRPVPSVSSGSDSQELMAVSTDPSQSSEINTSTAGLVSDRPLQSTRNKSDPDFVIYGRLPTQPGHESSQDQFSQENHKTNRGISTAGLSTDSDDDPFKYDRGSFTVFLQPTKEREVSAALRCVSIDSIASADGILQPSPPAQELSTSPGIPSSNPFVNRLHGYQASTVDYDWDDGDDTKEVKISLVRPLPVSPDSPELPTLGLSGFVQEDSKRRREDINTLMSDGADWETVVATSVGQFDSNRALASSTELSRSHLVGITGDSIADYSDTSSFHVPQFDEFCSRENILQHPVTNHSLTSRYPRLLQDTDRPVFSPQPRIHRVNGYLQNSRRMFSDTTTGSSANSARSALVDKLTTSIRSRNAKKQIHRRNQLLNEQWDKSKFESLESLSSTYSEQPEGAGGVHLPGTAHESGAARTSNNENQHSSAAREHYKQPNNQTEKPVLALSIPREPVRAHLRTDEPTGPCSLESPTLFPFHLITLEEARARRSQNADNFTITSGVRTRKNSSMDSSKATQATQRTTPPTPHILKPRPARSRHPTSASILGISVAHRSSSVYSQDRIAIGHDRGISNVTSYKSGTPLVAARSALSRTFNPFEPVGSSSLRSIHHRAAAEAPSVYGSPPCLISRDKRFGGGGGHTPDLHQIASMETGDGPFGAPTGDDSYLSWESRRRRQAYYFAMCMLCVFPFFAPLAYRGTFDSALSWYTRGEVASLTPRQRRNVGILGGVFACAWLVGLAILATVMIYRRNQQNMHG